MSAPSHTELLKQFTASAVKAVATVEVVTADAEALNAALERATAGDEHVLLSEPDDLDPALLRVFLKNPKVIIRPTREQFSRVPTGITDAFCAIASTGSVCVAMSANYTSPMSMLTRKHIVLVDSAAIVARPSDVFSTEIHSGTGLHRSFTFITGPSATADMGPLVRGVHGPAAVHIIVVEHSHDRI